MSVTVTLQRLAAVWSIDASVLQTRYQPIAILGYSPSPYSKQLKTNFEHRKIHWTLELEAGTGADSVFQPSVVLRFAAPNSNDTISPVLLDQLRSNRRAIDNGAPARMQQLFPEGAYFCHVLHGLTWVEAALRDTSLTQQAIDEAQLALTSLDFAECKSPFPPELPPDHGMFYSAWKAHLQAGIVLLQNGKVAGDLDSLRRQCDAIAESLAAAETPFLASYRGCVWPCDTVPAIHALKIHDHVTGENRYKDPIAKWLSDIASRLDPETGLIPHTANVHDGQPDNYARATSQVILLRMLPDIDPDFSLAQYEIFRQ